MAEAPASTVAPNAWQALRRHTPARIALGRSGVSQPTEAQLEFQLAHAQARDAVHRALDADALRTALQALGLSTLVVHSAAADRHVYLQRPDLGRRLDAASRAAVEARRGMQPHGGYDLAVVVADGLSALAIERHALPFVAALQRALAHDACTLAPVTVACQARVALGDEIGALLGARLVAVLIGERPGLSSPDSMGLYMTWSPRPGRTDAERNCISNIRPEGLPVDAAMAKFGYLLREARHRQLTGIALKDESSPAVLPPASGGPSFLLGEDASASE